MFGISVSKGKHTIFEIASDSKIIFPSSDSCVILSGITLGLILNTQSTHMQSLFWISVDITYSKNFNLEWCLELGEGGGGEGWFFMVLQKFFSWIFFVWHICF